MGLTRLHRDVTVFELGSVRLVVIVSVVIDLVVVCLADHCLMVFLFALDVDDGLVSFLNDRRRLQEERVRRAARLAAAVNVFGSHAKLVGAQRRQSVNHVRGRVAPDVVCCLLFVVVGE